MSDSSAADARAVVGAVGEFTLAGLEDGALADERFRGAIFDFDGTLATSMWVWLDIDRQFCREHGIELPEGYADDLVGLGFEGAAQYFIDELGCTLTLEECCDEFNRLAFDRYAHEVELKPGAVEFLRGLRERGVRCAIASSLNRKLLTAALHNNGVEDVFDAICLCDEHRTHKSEPLIYQIAARELGVVPGECVVFEDIVPGVRSAQAAGMRAVAAIDEGNEAQDTAAVRELADGCLRDFRGLLG
ncbi:MAG: HAD family phosphatase [Coriobacteriia bacterium]|nr:HAD family phosphatase [Coriobacteriia bacterium]